MDFEIVGEMTHIETIARGSGVRDRARLRRQYGRGRWRKLKGVAYVRLIDGSLRLAEIHEAHGIGKREFKTYEEEAAFWDNLDTADFMEDDGEWFRFDTPHKRAIRVAILPEIADELMQSAHERGVSIETLVNILLIERIRESVATS